jgi:hypothetical protein
VTGFMVVARLNLDDVPLGLFATEAEAEAKAKDAAWCEAKLRQGQQVLSVDTSSEICIAIFLFANGAFAGCRTERDWDETPDGEKASVAK